jgi:hypothetical protein
MILALGLSPIRMPIATGTLFEFNWWMAMAEPLSLRGELSGPAIRTGLAIGFAEKFMMEAAARKI